MEENDHYFFWKKYKVAMKNDHDFFNLKYEISNGDGYPDYLKAPEQIGKHQHSSKRSRKSSSQSSDVENKIKKKKSKGKLQKEEKQIDPISQVKKIFTDHEVQPKSEKKSSLHIECHSNQQLSEEEFEQDHSSISASSKQNSEDLFRSYKELAFIELSRENQEQKFFKGKVEFSQELKNTAKIISNEVEGYLIVDGAHLNRCLHEDQVYFTIIQRTKCQTVCSIVAIKTRRSSSIVGKVELLKQKNIYILRPINKRISKLIVEQNSLDKKFLEHVDSHYFLVEFTEWISENHYPSCRIIQEYGLIGNIQIQAKALMRTHGVQYIPYSKSQKHKIVEQFGDSLKEGKFTIPEAERKSRKDFRRWKTFIIKDNPYDIALSIFPFSLRDAKDPNFLKKNIYQINVHFMDVAYFVKQESILDELLKKRLNSYNTVFKTLPLLPEPLIAVTTFENNKERMCLSVCLRVDEDGIIEDTIKISRSIVRPECIFTSDQIEKIITEDEISDEQFKTWNCGLTIHSQISAYIKDVKLIDQLISKVRQNRVREGSFSFQSSAKVFKLDEQGKPLKFQLANQDKSYTLIHECSIAAQQKIGQYLFANLKERGIFYRHKFPGEKKLQKLKEIAVKIGHPILQSTKSEFHKDINELLVDPQIKPHLKEIMRYQIFVFLEQSDYFQIQNNDPNSWNNYMINIPIYSHCSAPTKRYGDIMVQRQIISVISKDQSRGDSQMATLLQKTNQFMLITKRVQDQCEKILLCQYLKKQPIFTTAVVLYLQKWGAKLSIPRYGFKTAIKFAKIPNLLKKKNEYDSKRMKSVKLEFKGSDGVLLNFALKELKEVQVRITSTQSFPINYLVSLLIPDPKDPAKKILIQ